MDRPEDSLTTQTSTFGGTNPKVEPTFRIIFLATFGAPGYTYHRMISIAEAPLKPGGREDPSLDTLLSLDGEIFPMDNGYWVKIDARRVAPNARIPHGIRYSLTLHDR